MPVADDELTPHEVRLLENIAGLNDNSGWGAAVSVSLEVLQGRGFVTRGPIAKLTDAGCAALAAIRGEKP